MLSEQAVSTEVPHEQLIMMAQLAKRAYDRSITALLTPDVQLARCVIEEDKAINSYEIDIDKSTFNILAAHVSRIPSETLRQILSIQKISPILERIGDHAVNIAESAENLCAMSSDGRLFELPIMAHRCKQILHDALLCFFEKNSTLAEKVLASDDEIDRLNLSITAEIKANALTGYEPLSFEVATEMIRVCKNLERIADLSSNIAEEASFAIVGRVVKHHAD